MQRGDRVPQGLLAAYVVLWAALAWAPNDRRIWFFENLLVFLVVPALVLSHRWFAFSDRTYVAIAVFLGLHAVGAHFGYTKVPIPWDDWGFERNHTDRVVHFAFGVLASLPVEEFLRRLAGIEERWSRPLAVACTFAFSAFFEVLEWLAVLVGGDAVGPLDGGYLGMQGDPFDAIKDMALALVGSAVTMAYLAIAHRHGAPDGSHAGERPQ